MTPSELLHDIRAYCETNADEAIVKKYRRYFKEGYDAYGLSRSIFEFKVAALLRDDKLRLRLVLDTAPLLIQSGKYEETSFAIRLLNEFVPQFSKRTFHEVEKWFTIGIVNWAHTDVLSLDAISVFLVNRIVSLQELAQWRGADNKYQRRAVPVSMIKLLGTTEQYMPFFKFIAPMMKDSHREVQQGLGWFLREAWKLRRTRTESFLLKWKDESPRLIYQYATEKMPAKEKERFKKENVVTQASTRRNTERTDGYYAHLKHSG